MAGHESTMLNLSHKWLTFLGSQPETGMGYQVVSVVLTNGQRYDQVVIVDGVLAEIRGLNEIPFAENDIAEIKVTHDKWAWRES